MLFSTLKNQYSLISMKPFPIATILTCESENHQNKNFVMHHKTFVLVISTYKSHFVPMKFLHFNVLNCYCCEWITEYWSKQLCSIFLFKTPIQLPENNISGNFTVLRSPCLKSESQNFSIIEIFHVLDDIIIICYMNLVLVISTLSMQFQSNEISTC